MPRTQISAGDGMYFYGMGRSLPHQDWKSKEVARFLLRHIIPRFGFPLSVGSDNGPAFVAELLQLACKAVNIKWKLHAVYRPQRSGTAERMNRTIRATLAKWLQETGVPWMDVLPLALTRIRMVEPLVPRVFLLWDNVREAFSTYLGSKGKFITKRRHEVSLKLEQLGEEIHDIIPYVQERIPFSLGTTIHP